MDKKYILGIDLGGTKITGAIADKSGEILYQITIPTLAKEGSEAVIDRIAGLCNTLIKNIDAYNDEVSGIGIGSPGFINSKSGCIDFASNLPGFENLPVVKLIEDKLNIKAYIENDAKAAALGELWFGAGKGCSSFVYMTVSTGIGGAIVVNGDIYSGMSNTSGEIGHVIIDPKGPKCGCGHYGCLEAYASGTAIASIAKERMEKGEDSILRSYETVTSKEVFEAVILGDRLANDVVKFCLHYLGIGVANIVTLLNPEKIIIGGGVSMAGQMIFDKIWEEVKENSFEPMYRNLEILPAKLKTDAGVIGALGVVLTREKNDKNRR